MGSFEKAKSVFARENRGYIVLDSNNIAINRLIDLIKLQPFSIVLLYGSPGVGKTFLLNRCYDMLQKDENLYLQKVPFEDSKLFFEEIFYIFTKTKPTKTNSLASTLLELESKLDKKITLLLDEVQMYKDEQLEFVRLLSDSPKIQIVLSLHKIDKEDLLAKEYFSSRIWETVELKNLSKKELRVYIAKQLQAMELGELNIYFEDKSCATIHKVTKGNLRTLNKLLFKIFEMYHYFDANEPSKISRGRIEPKHIEMAALDLGILK